MTTYRCDAQRSCADLDGGQDFSLEKFFKLILFNCQRYASEPHFLVNLNILRTPNTSGKKYGSAYVYVKVNFLTAICTETT